MQFALADVRVASRVIWVTVTEYAADQTVYRGGVHVRSPSGL
jgi:hypothetical protein